MSTVCYMPTSYQTSTSSSAWGDWKDSSEKSEKGKGKVIKIENYVRFRDDHERDLDNLLIVKAFG